MGFSRSYREVAAWYIYNTYIYVCMYVNIQLISIAFQTSVLSQIFETPKCYRTHNRTLTWSRFVEVICTPCQLNTQITICSTKKQKCFDWDINSHPDVFSIFYSYHNRLDADFCYLQISFLQNSKLHSKSSI